MKSFKDVFLKEDKLKLFESIRDETITGRDIAFREICESSLSRLWSRVQNNSFAVLTAYRGNNTKTQNVSLNRDLRHDLNRQKMGPHPVIGHWQECSLTDKNGDPVEYKLCPKDKLVDVIERSYFVVKPSIMSDDDFESIIFGLGQRYKQDGVVLKSIDNGKFGVFNPRSGQAFVTFNKGIGMNQVAQAYSRHVKKQNIPFIFEGVEKPTATSTALLAFRKDGFWW